MKALIQRCLLILLLAAMQVRVSAQDRACVHTDREVYISGETLFYHISLHEEGGQSSVAYLLIRDTKSATVARTCIKLQEGAASGYILLPDTLQSGAYQLLAFTNSLRNAGEAGYFRKEILVANLFDKDLKAFTFRKPEDDSLVHQKPLTHPVFSLEGLKTIYTTGEAVTLQLAINGGMEEFPHGVSVSVKETIPGGFNAPEVRKSLQTREEKHPNNYLPETAGQILRGRIVNTGTGGGISGCCVSVSARDTLPNLQYAFTDEEGRFRFLLDDYYQEREGYIIVLNPENLPPFRIEIEDKFRMNDAFIPEERIYPASLKSYIHHSQDIFRVNRSYGLLQKERNVPASDSAHLLHRVYDKADHEVYPSDFEPLPDFMEISREILPTVRTRRNGSRSSLVLADKVNHEYFTEPPALFINGVYTGDFQPILSWGSDRIRKIEVVNVPRVFGSLYFPGILSVVTYGKVALPATPLQVERYSPQCTLLPFIPSSDLREPDFRQLLFWDTLAAGAGLPQQLKFHTSMHTGTYEICIRGMNRQGETTESVYLFTVK